MLDLSFKKTFENSSCNLIFKMWDYKQKAKVHENLSSISEVACVIYYLHRKASIYIDRQTERLGGALTDRQTNR